LWLVLSLLIKEEIAFVVLGLGLYAWLVLHRRNLGLAVMAAGAGWAIVCLDILLPAFAGQGQGVYFVEAYTYLGSTPQAMLWGALTHPWLVARHLLTPDRLAFIVSLLAPLGFMPLIGFRIKL